MPLEFIKVRSSSTLQCLAVATAILVAACTSEKTPGGEAISQPAAQTAAASPAPSEAPIDSTSTPRSDVAFTWRDAKKMTGAIFGASQLLVTDLTNLR